MIIDKQGKLFGKVNIIDIFIVLIIISAAIILGAKLSTDVTTGGTTTAVEYTVKVRGIRNSSEKYFVPGADVYNEKDEYVGKIVEIKNVNEAVHYELLSSGEYAEIKNPSRIDLDIVLKADATKNDKGYYIDGKIALLCGQGKHLSTKDIEVSGVVTELVEVK